MKEPRLSTSVLRAVVCTALLATLTHPASAQPSAAPPTLTAFSGAIHTVRSGPDVGLVFSTSDGLVVVDPLSVETASWLNKAIAATFPGRAVRFVVHTRHDFERAAGSGAFGRTVPVVAQERFNDERGAAARSLPARLASLDANGDGVLQPGEVAASPVAGSVRAYDLNGDGTMTGADFYSRVSGATRTFNRRDTLTLGGATIEMWSAPAAGASDNAVVFFPAERVVFAAGLFDPQSLPAHIGVAGAAALARSFKTIETLDFDVMLTGTGREVTKADVTAYREYLEALADAVSDGFAAGRTVAELQDSLALEPYRQWAGYGTNRRANIAEAYAALRPTELSALVAGAYALTGGSGRCAEEQGCLLRDAHSPAAMAGLMFTVGRFGGGARVFLRRPTTAHFGAANDVQRDTVVAFSVSYTARPRGGLTAVVHGGPALIVSKHAATYFIYLSSPYDFTETEIGWGAGVDLHSRIGRRLTLVIPVQLVQGRTRSSETGPFGFTVGAGLSLAVTRGVR